MEISTARVKELRELSGAGVMDCKRALESAQGDLGRALEILRAQGIARAAERVGRETSEGIVEAYVHGEGRIGVLVELQCETDFVARTPEFRQLAHDVALQVAAMDPPRVNDDGEAVISDRRHDPGLDQVPLLKQPFVKDSARTVGEIVQELAAKTGENILVRRFTRYQVGS